jgi:hypothetical protein
MLVADAMMDAGQPSFQVGEDEMDDRQIRLGHLRIARQQHRVAGTEAHAYLKKRILVTIY